MLFIVNPFITLIISSLGDKDSARNSQAAVKTEDNHPTTTTTTTATKANHDNQPARMIHSRDVLTGLSTQTVSSDSEPSAKKQRIEIANGSPDSLAGVPAEVTNKHHALY